MILYLCTCICARRQPPPPQPIACQYLGPFIHRPFDATTGYALRVYPPCTCTRPDYCTRTVSICSKSTQYTATRRIKATIQLLVASYATTLRHGPPCGHLWRERAARVERRGPPHSQPAATSASPSRVSTFPPACAIPTPNFHLRAPLRRRRAHHGQALRWRPDRAQRSGATRARRARLAGARCLVITPRGAPPPAGRCVCPTRRRAPRPRGAARWPPARRCRSPRGRA